MSDSEVISRCGWTPLAGMTLPARIEMTMVNGTVVYEAGSDPQSGAAMALEFGTTGEKP
ncbi:hypothetical protein [Duncaniella muris]|uniref:hypothetical protein n=1 Tax=Duncaniella muris TaxID=2094150 RepID=UPI00272D5D23|nr:hypothetical protein [Duncaniella muris]